MLAKALSALFRPRPCCMFLIREPLLLRVPLPELSVSVPTASVFRVDLVGLKPSSSVLLSLSNTSKQATFSWSKQPYLAYGTPYANAHQC